MVKTKSVDDWKLEKKLQAESVLVGFLELAKYIVEVERKSLIEVYVIRDHIIHAMACEWVPVDKAWGSTIGACDRVKELITRHYTDKMAYLENGKAMSLHVEDSLYLAIQDIKLLVSHGCKCISAKESDINLIGQTLDLAAGMYLTLPLKHGLPISVLRKLDTAAQRQDELFKMHSMSIMARKIADINSATKEAA